MEGVFEGTISVSPRSPFGDSRASSWYSPSWLDIVAFAKTNPGDFNLTTTPDGRRVCQFYLKDVRVEISEDDWRFIVSGALDRFHLVPTHPLEEDETAELATLEILELRLQTLINKADEVARKARQLNYHLSGRKASIIARLSSQHQSHAGASRSVNPLRRSGGPNPGYDLHADLLQQFLVPSPQPISRARVLNPPPSPLDIIRHRATPSITQQPQLLLQSSRPSPPHGPDSPVHRDISYDHPSSVHRPLIQARIEKLSRGDAIAPPCDRCRRLKTQCIKHLTACQGCTKKHAKCSWRGVTDDEIHALRGEQQQQHLLLPPSASAPPGADEDAAEDTPGSSNPREAAAARMSGEPDLREEEEEGQGHGQAPAHNNSSAPAEHAPPLPLPRHGMAGAPLSYLLHAEPHRDKPSR
ncbi:hypothetical protein QBC33DRAFT_534365 [Phialemonium atrogriseum]|uniref:Zn(2)-C6 fungal-type domain-containing protein n=1 Tax=Phialemonium atrogriseum TaxID=1093897 RepID=A0AAJ0C2I9_9PEZI|nr:uncharacterized protein QBC33DRAFT_534365 [Phialemonium atrogriseum]KAK1768980.1 hypothetical protein QBC33DRAFT_534365 [Phialemonium atrogriseum]